MTIDPQTPLSDLMTTDLIVVQPTDSLKAVADVFRKNEIHHLPVVETDGQLVGLVSRSDFLKISYGWSLFRNSKKELYDDVLYETLLVKEVMTTKLVTLGPEDSVSVALGIFKENLFHCIPIVEAGLLVGLVSTYDMLNFAFREQNYSTFRTK